MSRKQLILAVLVVVVADGVASQGLVNTDADNLAVKGYDPVAYFTEGAPVPGDAAFTFEHNGAVYRFSSRANRDTFAADPEAFAPAYGGYCAWAVSQGYTADIDPETWVIEDGRLFLNFNGRIGRRFAGDLTGNIERADRNWIEIGR